MYNTWLTRASSGKHAASVEPIVTILAESLILITFMDSHGLNVVYVVIKLDKKH